MKEVQLFGENAGPRIINWSKSNLMKININDRNDEGLYFTDDPIKCLGIYVGKYSTSVYLNYTFTVVVVDTKQGKTLSRSCNNHSAILK